MSKKSKKKSAKKKTVPNWRRRRLTTAIAIFVWLLLSGFGYVWCRVQVVELGYQLSDSHQLHSRLMNDNKKLHLELARLKAPERVQRIAIEQLGLKQPTKDQIVVLQ
ncbi:MAG: cell division protein FtsL [Deltaproteobacteria bacterium]|jgi:cell division protein FtsL|nr:cell division protein FtsL [Deltaproteobacteria bacterium]